MDKEKLYERKNNRNNKYKNQDKHKIDNLKMREIN